MTETTSKLIDLIQSGKNILVCGHMRPDGDCIGAALAMRRICENLGKTADAVCDADKPVSFAFLPDIDRFCKPRKKSYDVFISVDCANEKRLGAYSAALDAAEHAVDIDHHPFNPKFGDINVVDESASSTCLIIYELFKDTELMDLQTAELLYTGISTDTGHFMHSNTDARTFSAAMGLMELGLDIGRINHDIYCNKSKRKIKLTARALDGMEYYAGGAVALMTLSLADLGECGCTSEDTEGLIDFAKSVEGVKIAVSMCEQEGGTVRVSLRSVEADVSAVAGRFGGGGHKLASGCMVSGTLDYVKDKIVSAAAEALGVAK